MVSAAWLGGCTATPAATDMPSAMHTDTEVAQAAEALASLLEQEYVIPETGAKWAAMLRKNAASGRYDALSGADLGKMMTTDLQAVAPDRHLRVVPEGEARRPGAPQTGPAPNGGGAAQPAAPARPTGILDQKWIEDGIAYIAFANFPGDPQTVANVDAFMRGHADAKALIIDARNHRGGGAAEIDAILRYLFSKDTTVVGMDLAQGLVDENGPPPGSPYMAHVDGPPDIYRRMHIIPPNDETRLRDAKVFYLTSNRTASAAEHLALALKHTHRATLIGEHTAGANHFGGYQPIGAGLAAFIPIGRTFDPDTGEDWEGKGIEPDIAVPEDTALETALKLARTGG
jgi:hypothetical protein